MKPLKDKFLESLRQVYEKNPDDLDFKKYFALELYKKSEFKNSYELLMEVFKIDKDINVEKAIKDIEMHMPKEKTEIGFKADDKKPEPEIANLQKKMEAITFANVAGMEEVKEAIRTDIIYPFEHPEIYKEYGQEAGGGILLFGPPGCGKTFIARATAGEIKANFYSASIHELLNHWLGEGEKYLHDKFEEARINAPSVLFFDEIDAIGISRGKGSTSIRSLTNQFLTELDGITSENKNVLVMGATNIPWEVDSALRRPGRFSRVLFVAPPDLEARERLFELSLKNKPAEIINFKKLAKETKHYSGADITNICKEAAQDAFKQAVKSGKTVKITGNSLEEKIKNSKPSIDEWFSTVKNYIEYSNDSGLFNSVKDYLEKLKNE